MIKIVEPNTKQDFIRGAQLEPLVGAKLVSFLDAYGLENWNIASFWVVYNEENKVMGSILRTDGSLNLSLDANVNLAELLDFFNVVGGFFEIFLIGELSFLRSIASHIGGVLSHSTACTYTNTINDTCVPTLLNTNPNLTDVFHCIKTSIPYFNTRVHYETWLSDISYKVRHHLAHVIAIQEADTTVSTGGLYSIGTHHAVLGCLATHPEHRGKGYATHIVNALVQKSLELKKTPSLFCMNDALVPFYENLGFVPCGIWGNISLR